MLSSELVPVCAQVRDHVKKSGGKPPRWRRMLGYHFMARIPRDPSAVMLQVKLQLQSASVLASYEAFIVVGKYPGLICANRA